MDHEENISTNSPSIFDRYSYCVSAQNYRGCVGRSERPPLSPSPLPDSNANTNRATPCDGRGAQTTAPASQRERCGRRTRVRRAARRVQQRAGGLSKTRPRRRRRSCSSARRDKRPTRRRWRCRSTAAKRTRASSQSCAGGSSAESLEGHGRPFTSATGCRADAAARVISRTFHAPTAISPRTPFARDARSARSAATTAVA